MVPPSGIVAQNRNRKEPHVSETVTYAVPAIHCQHCAASIREEVSEVAGVESVDVDLDSKVVTITAQQVDDAALRAAIGEAGYEAA